MNETLEFFETLFGYKPPEAWILVWGLKGKGEDAEKVSRWVRTTEEAALAAQGFGEGWNVYFGVSLSSQAWGASQRLRKGEREPAGIFGFWADIDLRGPEHAEKDYPETLSDVETLITDAGMEPTIWVHSGHGIQCEWVFKEPWIFETVEEREKARRLSVRWKRFLAAKAKARGWTIDSVSDLERVLRVPGTTNWKGEPVPARILKNGGPQWSEGDFDERLPETDPFEEEAEGGVEVGPLTLKKDAEPPWKKLRALEANDEKFKLSIQRKRKDFPSGKNSASEYDQSLASIAARAGWTDQEIANLMIYARVENGEDILKTVMRPDYVRGTIKLARAGVEHEIAVTEIGEMCLQARNGDGDRIDKSAWREKVQAALCVKVLRVVKIKGEEASYWLETDKEPVKLGSIHNLIDQGRLRSKIADKYGQYIPIFKQERWKDIAQALLELREEVETGPETTDNGLIAAWLASYLDGNKPKERSDDRIRLGLPFEEDSRISIYAGSLQDHILRAHAERVSLRDLCQRLTRFGARQGNENYPKAGGKMTSRSYWKLPDHEVTP
jgi:hypothetical protein